MTALRCITVGDMDAAGSRQFCPRCGTQAHLADLFCAKCGAPLQGTPAEAPSHKPSAASATHHDSAALAAPEESSLAPQAKSVGQTRRGLSGQKLIVGAVVLLALATCVAIASSNNSGSTSEYKVMVHSTIDRAAQVGSGSTLDIAITNAGSSQIPKAQILFDDGDHFLDHNVILSSTGCAIDRGVSGLDCGTIDIGATMAVRVIYQPKDAGNWTYKFHIANDGRWLNEPDGKGYTYSMVQTVIR